MTSYKIHIQTELSNSVINHVYINYIGKRWQNVPPSLSFCCWFLWRTPPSHITDWRMWFFHLLLYTTFVFVLSFSEFSEGYSDTFFMCSSTALPLVCHSVWLRFGQPTPRTREHLQFNLSEPPLRPSFHLTTGSPITSRHECFKTI